MWMASLLKERPLNVIRRECRVSVGTVWESLCLSIWKSTAQLSCHFRSCHLCLLSLLLPECFDGVITPSNPQSRYFVQTLVKTTDQWKSNFSPWKHFWPLSQNPLWHLWEYGSLCSFQVAAPRVPVHDVKVKTLNPKGQSGQERRYLGELEMPLKRGSFEVRVLQCGLITSYFYFFIF